MTLKKMTLKQLARKVYLTVIWNGRQKGSSLYISNDAVGEIISELIFEGWKQFEKVTDENFERFCRMVRKGIL